MVLRLTTLSAAAGSSTGKMLKKIGQESRISIEGFLEKKVFLELWVKVRQGWSDDKRALASLGYD